MARFIVSFGLSVAAGATFHAGLPVMGAGLIIASIGIVLWSFE